MVIFFSFFFLLKNVTLAAGVIVGLGGENELNKDPTLSNTKQAAPIPEFKDSSDFDSPSNGEFHKINVLVLEIKWLFIIM